MAFEDPVAALRARIAVEPEAAPAYMELADRLAEAGDSDAALDALRRTLAILTRDGDARAPAFDARQAEATAALATALDSAGRGDPVPYLARIRAAYGPEAGAALLTARRARRVGDAEAARDACELALAHDPSRPEMPRLAATLAAPLAVGADETTPDPAPDPAVVALAAATSLAPADAEAPLRLGQRLHALGRPTAAPAAALRTALHRDPTCAEAWHALAALLHGAGEGAAALPVARQILALAPEDPRGPILLAALEGVIALPPAALAPARCARPLREAALRAAALADATDSAAPCALGDAWSALGRPAEALAWYRRAQARHPETPGLAARATAAQAHLARSGPSPARLVAAPDAETAGARPDGGAASLYEGVARVAPWLGSGPIAVAPLAGDQRGRSYRLDSATGRHVLRLGRFPPRTPRQHVEECANMARAARAGLAPPALYADPADGTLLTPHVSAPARRGRELRDPATAADVGRLYRRLHGLAGFLGHQDPFIHAARREVRLAEHGSPCLREAAAVQAAMRAVQAALKADPVPLVACHNDPRPARLHGEGDAMLLVDWDFSALGDPHAELAALVVQADLDAAAQAALYDAYLGADDPEGRQRRRLALFEVQACWYRWLRAVEAAPEARTADTGAADTHARAVARWWRRLDRRLKAEPAASLAVDGGGDDVFSERSARF